jgi:hypothetical protein
MLKVYLCGPINGCTDEECNGWRALVRELFHTELVTGRLKQQVFLVDPMRRDYRGREEESWREIVELDKVDVGGCDAVLASVPKPSVGTSMEILWAWERGKLVVGVVPPGGKVSPWLRYHCAYLVHSYREGVQLIAKLLG